MAVKQILLYPDPLLLRTSVRIDTFDENLVSLAKDLIDTMYDADGVGLAAPQIGINKRIFVMDCTREDEDKDFKIVINPEIEHESEELGAYNEGCLSILELQRKFKDQKLLKWCIKISTELYRETHLTSYGRQASSMNWII